MSLANLTETQSQKTTQQEDHDGPISLTRVLNSKGRQPYVPTCDPRGGARFDPKGIK